MSVIENTVKPADRIAEIMTAHTVGYLPKPRDWHSNSEIGLKCNGCDKTWLFAEDPDAGATARRHVAELIIEEHSSAGGSADFYKSAAISQNQFIQDVLAPALGYPAYAAGTPGYSDSHINYDIGDHTAETLADEAAERIRNLPDAGHGRAIAREAAVISARIASSEFYSGDVVLMESEFEHLQLALQVALEANSLAMEAHQYAMVAAHAVTTEGSIDLTVTPGHGHETASLITAIIGVNSAGSDGVDMASVRSGYAKIIRADHPELAQKNHRFIIIQTAGAEDGNASWQV